jgi:hypothetical protein
VGVVKEAQTLGLSGGTVPLPVIRTEEDPDAGIPEQPPELVWDGSYAELLASDAWAVCSLTQQVGAERPLISIDDRDEFLLFLYVFRQIAIGSAGWCPETFGTSPGNLGSIEASHWQWLDKRRNPDCNAHATTLAPEGLDVEYTPVQRHASAYGLPNEPSDFDPDLTGANADDALEYTRIHVQYAYLNLCMAQRLQDQLESLEVAFAAREDLIEL